MMSGGEFFACSTWLQYIAPAVVPRGAAGALSIAAAAGGGGGGAGIIADNFADEIILEPRQIAVHYVKTWFLLDLVSSIPLDYIILLLELTPSRLSLVTTSSCCTLHTSSCSSRPTLTSRSSFTQVRSVPTCANLLIHDLHHPEPLSTYRKL